MALASVVVLVLAVVPVATGVAPWPALAWAAVIAVQAAGGAIVWRALAGPCRPVELVGMGLAIGTALAVVPGTLLAPLPGGSVTWSLAPSIIAIAVAVARRARSGGIRACGAGSPGTAPALALGAVLGLGAFALNVRAYPLATDVPWTRFHSDMPYFEALATSFARYGPWDSLLAEGFVLRYHALAYAWAGNLAELADAGPFAAITRALPLVATIGTVLIAIAWSQRLLRSRWLPSLAVVVLLAGGYLGATYGSVLNFDSPSQSMGAMWLMALVVMATAVRPERRPRVLGWALALAVVSFALAGGKVSSAAVAVAGLLTWALVAVVRRDAARHALVASGSVLVGALTAFLALLAGAADAGGLTPFALIDRASSQQGLNPLPGGIGVVAGTLALAVAIASRWAGIGWLLGDRRWRWRPETIASFGMAAASIVAMLVFNGGLNETWFAAGASGPLAVTTALGAVLAGRFLLRGPVSPGPLLAFLAAATALATAVTWALWLTGPSGGNVWVSTLRWAGPFAGIAVALLAGIALAAWTGSGSRLRTAGAVVAVVLVGASASMRALGAGTDMVGQQPGFRGELFSLGTKAPVHGADRTVLAELSPSVLDAAAWVRANLPDFALMATGLTFSPVIPALTGRQALVAGLQFQVPYGFDGDAAPLLARDALVAGFLAAPSAATLQPLCDAGVDALWLDAQTARSAAALLDPRYANDEVVIAAPRCR